MPAALQKCVHMTPSFCLVLIFLYRWRFVMGQIKRNKEKVHEVVHCVILIVYACCSINSKCISDEKLLSYGMWHHVVSYKCTDVSGEPATSIISADEFVPNYHCHWLQPPTWPDPQIRYDPDLWTWPWIRHSQIIANQWCQTSLPTHEISHDHSGQQV